jgi:dTDP-4-amino-4,6-dideoxygalactose transaminase
MKTILPTVDADPVWHLFVIEVERRDDVINRLQARGIGTGVHYPLPLHMQPALRHLGYAEGDFPVTEAASRRVLSLPMCAELTDSQLDEVCRELAQAML